VVAGRTEERSARDRIEEICRSTSDATALRVDVLAQLRRVVAFDAHVWLLCDPRTAVGSAPLAEVPSVRELPETIRLKYLTALNRWTGLGSAPDGVATLHQQTSGDLAQSLIWRSLLSRYAVCDVASVVFSNRFGVWGFLDLWREAPAPAFTDEDAAFLGSISAPLTAALQHCQASTLTAPAVSAARELGPVVFLVDESLAVVSQTPGSESWLRLLLPSASGVPVPASVYNVAAQLLAVEQGVDDHPATARVHLTEGFWVTLRAARLSGLAATIAVTMEETSSADRLEIFALAYGLTHRENELLSALATGRDTRELARLMFLAETTVQDHLKAIFAKTGARNRRTLLARALGARGE
jgi:DNA-binding CsgD family transcriptional regulator